MSDREEVLRRWVQQPPATPNVQYLRDAEREAALNQLGNRSPVLDVASESNVTAGIEGESVTRVDFSDDSAAHAREILDGAVDGDAVVDPESPSLPFPADEFEAAVSVGPFDWKFLDVGALVDELHRVVDDNGLLVFSVPTPRSPYAGDRRNRVYEPREALGLVSPDWLLCEHDQIFQYPGLVNAGVNTLPATVQEPLVSVEQTVSSILTATDAWDRASYLVLGVQPLDYEAYLTDALARLFRPTAETGFFDPDVGTFVRAWEYERSGGDLVWTLDDDVEWRYAPFATMGTLQWRCSPVGNDRYDDEIRRVLAYFSDRVSDGTTLDAMPSYGLGPLIVAFTLAGRVFGDDSYAETARNLYEHTTGTCDFSHAEDSLVLYGWTYLYEDGVGAVGEDIRDALWTVNETLSGEGLFAFDNPTTLRHQNQMYTLWGFCRAIEVTDSSGFLATAESVLDYTVGHRMRDDGAFLWEDLPPTVAARTKAGAALGRGTGRTPYWKHLYACHQTFFVNAVEHYYAAGGSKDYDLAVRKAMEWVYGRNDLDRSLVDCSGLGVPMRVMTTDGRLDVDGQQFKGAYEVGSYVMALTNLLSGAVAPNRTAGGRPGPR